jgi:hypothetical protein
MSDQPFVSAQIIPFPSRRPATPTDAMPTGALPTGDGQERLRRALLALDAAVSEQRVAVAAWRGALADLGTVMHGLGESVQRLDALDSRVAGLNAQAVQLERTADAALALRPD